MNSIKECDFVLKNISSYIDKDLDKTCCEKIKKHLEKCKDCNREYNDIKKILDLCKNSFVKMDKKDKKNIYKNIDKLLKKE